MERIIVEAGFAFEDLGEAGRSAALPDEALYGGAGGGRQQLGVVAGGAHHRRVSVLRKHTALRKQGVGTLECWIQLEDEMELNFKLNKKDLENRPGKF